MAGIVRIHRIGDTPAMSIHITVTVSGGVVGCYHALAHGTRRLEGTTVRMGPHPGGTLVPFHLLTEDHSLAHYLK